MSIDMGDTVYHRPSKETWLVARVDDRRVYYCGYPFGGYGQLEDCKLKRKATGEQRTKLLQDIAGSSGREGASIVAWAKQQLTPTKDTQ